MTTDSGLGEIRFGDGGLLYRAARALRLIPDSGALLYVGCAVALVAWLPLLLLNIVEHTAADGPSIAFKDSLGTHARFLITAPLLFLSESLFTRRLLDVHRRMLETQLVAPADLPRFMRLWRQAHHLWDSRIIEAILAIITIASIARGFRSDLPAQLSTWRTVAGGGMSMAGAWYAAVSLPLFQFLLWRWAWRLLVWGRLLWQMSRLRLQLVPTHPDRAAGLGGLGVAQTDLAPLALAISTTLAATFAEQIRFGTALLTSFAVPATTVVLASTLCLLGPLLFFARRLTEVRQRGLLEYGAFAMSYARAFDMKWIRSNRPHDAAVLGTADLQSLADLGNSFTVIAEMWIVPVSRTQILVLIVAAGLPMLGLVFFAYPLDELLIRLVESMIGT